MPKHPNSNSSTLDTTIPTRAFDDGYSLSNLSQSALKKYKLQSDDRVEHSHIQASAIHTPKAQVASNDSGRLYTASAPAVAVTFFSQATSRRPSVLPARPTLRSLSADHSNKRRSNAAVPTASIQAFVPVPAACAPRYQGSGVWLNSLTLDPTANGYQTLQTSSHGLGTIERTSSMSRQREPVSMTSPSHIRTKQLPLGRLYGPASSTSLV